MLNTEFKTIIENNLYKKKYKYSKVKFLNTYNSLSIRLKALRPSFIP
jgi:hypothetical protein